MKTFIIAIFSLCCTGCYNSFSADERDPLIEFHKAAVYEESTTQPNPSLDATVAATSLVRA